MIREARSRVERMSDPFTCISDRAAFLDSQPRLPSSFDRSAAVYGNARNYTATIEGLLCMQAAARMVRERYVSILAAATASGDFAGAARQIKPDYERLIYLQGQARTLSYKWSDLSPRAAGSKYSEAATATNALWTGPEATIIQSDLGMVRYAFPKDDPQAQAFYRALTDHVLGISDRQQLQTLAQSLLPLFNIGMESNSSSIDIINAQGAGRRDVANGRNPLTAVRNEPTADNVLWLMIALADPMQRNALAVADRAATGKAAGAPSAGELAAMLADAFYRSHADYANLAAMGMLRQQGRSPYAVHVEWAVPMQLSDRQTSLPVWADRVTFLVSDLDPPQCTPSGSAWNCKISMDIHREVVSVQGELGKALFGALIDTPQQSAADRERQFELDLSNRNFNWTPMTIAVSKQQNVWRSPLVDQAMRALATRLDKERLATARSMQASQPVSTDPAEATCKMLRAGASANPSSSIPETFVFKYYC